MTKHSHHYLRVYGGAVFQRRVHDAGSRTPVPRRMAERLARCLRYAVGAACVVVILASSSWADVPTAKALETGDDRIRDQFEAAVAAYADAEFVLAERRFRELAERVGIPDADRQVFSFMVAKCLYAQGEYTFTLRHLDRFRDLFPESPFLTAARIVSGHCAYRTGDLPGAAREYAVALAGGPATHRRIALANLEPLVRRGLSLRQLERVLAGLTDDPWSAPVRFWVAERWATSGRRQDAAEQYLIAADLAADTTLANTARARAAQLERPAAWSLTIGLLAPLSGDFAPFGDEVRAAAQMAADRWGKTIRLVTIDTRGDPLRAAHAADSLVDIGCHAVIGPLRNDCIAATIAVFRAHDIVQVLPVARRGGTELTGMGPRLFALSVPPDRQARRLLHAAMSEDRMQRFACFAADTPEGRAAGRAFVTAVLAADATIYPIQYFAPATIDFSRPLRTLKRIIRDDRDEALPTPSEVDEMERQQRLAEQTEPEPVFEFENVDTTSGLAEEEDETYDLESRWRVELDGLMIWADPEDIRQIVLQARALGFTGRFLGNAGWGDQALRNTLAAQIDSVLFVSDEQIDENRLEWRTFSSDFRGRFGRAPGWLAGRTYDAISWLVQPTTDHPDPLDPLKWLSMAEEFEGVTTTYRFAPDRQQQAAAVYRYIYGRPVRLTGPAETPERSPE
ncbi:MAG TPA: ABC transporter substrate-binding protein [Acidobacteriota bacterium]|nr:ABC transporter substrate-binding protein [Acidobacteriota bacterium]